jgi:hypothetical protein
VKGTAVAADSVEEGATLVCPIRVRRCLSNCNFGRGCDDSDDDGDDDDDDDDDDE